MRRYMTLLTFATFCSSFRVSRFEVSTENAAHGLFKKRVSRRVLCGRAIFTEGKDKSDGARDDL